MAAPTIITSILTGGSSSHQTSSEEANAVATDFVSEGIVGTLTNTSGVAPATGGFAVNASGTPDANINISTGVAYVTATPSSQNSQALRIKCTVTGTLAISANSSGSTKYDWIYISVSATNSANPNSGADNVATIVASRSSSASTDDGSPPTYGYPIAVVTLSNGFTTITNANIRDIRTNAIVNLSASSTTTGWIDLGYTPNTVTCNGNRSYDVVFNSVDLTSTLSKGMRLKLTRLVTAPTQCTDLESSSSQYWNKTSPAGMTFTDDFVVSVWVKLESYGGSTGMAVVSRTNGTSGWSLRVGAAGVNDGRVQLIGTNAGGANFSYVASYQSIPLNKWVHITAQLDMSAFTATTTTSYIMIDGVDAPSTVARGGTNPTAIVQAGNLEIGGENGGTLPFDGKIAQASVYSAKVTQATIRTYLSQTLAGNETSNASTFTFNGNGNDSNANANNLTAQNSATATSTDTPFAQGATGTTEYGIVTGAAFSTNTTLNIQVPEGSAIPTSGGVSAVAYSSHKVPFGFPVTKEKWYLELIVLQVVAASGATANTTYNPGGLNLNVPIGPWLLTEDITAEVTTNANVIDMYTALSTSSTVFIQGSRLNFRTTTNIAASSAANIFGVHKDDYINLTTATPYYILLRPTSTYTAIQIRGDTTAAFGEITVIRADLASL